MLCQAGQFPIQWESNTLILKLWLNGHLQFVILELGSVESVDMCSISFFFSLSMLASNRDRAASFRVGGLKKNA